MRKPTIQTYRQDKYYPRVKRAVARILERDDVVRPVEVFIETGLLARKDHDDWRRGRVPYLERVIAGNLSKVNRILRVLRFHAHDLKLTPGGTDYRQWGARQRRLRFSKSGERRLEEAYATHFIRRRSRRQEQARPFADPDPDPKEDKA